LRRGREERNQKRKERKERRGGPGALSLGALSPPALIAAGIHVCRRERNRGKKNGLGFREVTGSGFLFAEIEERPSISIGRCITAGLGPKRVTEFPAQAQVAASARGEPLAISADGSACFADARVPGWGGRWPRATAVPQQQSCAGGKREDHGLFSKKKERRPWTGQPGPRALTRPWGEERGARAARDFRFSIFQKQILNAVLNKIV